MRKNRQVIDELKVVNVTEIFGLTPNKTKNWLKEIVYDVIAELDME
jgi:hypothetical protein